VYRSRRAVIVETAPMRPDCLAPDLFQSLFAGTRPPENATALLGHLEGCAACRERLALLLPDVRPHRAFLPGPPAPGGRGGLSADEAVNTPAEFWTLTGPRDRPGVPRRLGPYEVVQVLGRGGMGTVVKAVDPSLGRFVAVKVLSPHRAADEACRERFVREARAAARIGSDHVTAVHTVGIEGDCPYIAMEYVRGEDLESRLRRGRRFGVAEAARLGRQIAAGLAAAHAEGVVHRDVKPGNVLLSADDPDGGCGPVPRVKLTDFGLARAPGAVPLTAPTEVVGTPEYMAPEQLCGEGTDHRVDLYALGLVLYRMTAGRLPFVADSPHGYFSQHLHARPPRPSEFTPGGLPDWFEALVLRLLRKDPAERVQTAREVAGLLDEGAARASVPPADPEARRLAALRGYRVLDTGAEQAFDDLTFLASHVCRTPIALVSLVDEDRQWFKSRVGLSVSQTARSVSFCQHTIRGRTALVVEDATGDPRFADNPFVRSDPNIRFYAGVPLIEPGGCALGSLCVIDRVPRTLSPEQVAALAALSRLVVNQLHLRREMMGPPEGNPAASG
jgi:serine/threonine-protein kinase